jgi:hypothetical protein
MRWVGNVGGETVRLEKRIAFIESIIDKFNFIGIAKKIAELEDVLQTVDDKIKSLDNLKFILVKMIKNQDPTHAIRYMESGGNLNACVDCGREGDLHWHHVVPRVKGGTFTVPLCEMCHSLVHHADPEKFLNHSNLIKEGIAKARVNGAKPGRPSTITAEKFSAIKASLADGQSVRQSARDHSISKTTVIRIKQSASYEEYSGAPRSDSYL